MRILVAVGLFSGFESSVAQSRWSPAGTPAVYRLVEGLDQSCHTLDFVLLGRQQGRYYQVETDRLVSLRPLRTTVHVVAGSGALPEWVGRFRYYLGELRKFLWLWRHCRRYRPEIVYVERGNVFVGGLLARLTRIPVVLRMLGIPPSTKEEMVGKNIYAHLQRFAFRSPFALVICTQAGTGAELWLSRIFKPSVPTRTLLNGVVSPTPQGDPPSALCNLPMDRTIVLTVGRLEARKQPLQFVDAIARLVVDGEAVHGLIVGEGSLSDNVRQRIRESGALEHITLVGELPHRSIVHALALADLFVSLNVSGNLSNSVLEAMKAGLAIVVPPSQPEVGVDLALDTMFPEDTVLRLADSDDPSVLVEALRHLIRNPIERNVRAKRIRAVADRLLPTWQARIEEEIRMLEGIAQTGVYSGPVDKWDSDTAAQCL